MLTEFLLGIVNFIWYNLLSLFWPAELPIITLNTLNTALTFYVSSLQNIWQTFNMFFPADTLMWCFACFIGLHIIVFMFQTAKFFAKMFLGARIK